MADMGSRIKDIANDAAKQIMAEWSSEISEQIAMLIEKRLRTEMAGDRGYISSASTASREEKIKRVRAMFNGRNAAAIARELHMGRATVYRILKIPG